MPRGAWLTLCCLQQVPMPPPVRLPGTLRILPWMRFVRGARVCPPVFMGARVAEGLVPNL